MEAFVLKGKKYAYKRKNDSEQAVVRITPEAYNALVDMANESVLPIKEIASQAILYANRNLVIDREDSDIEWTKIEQILTLLAQWKSTDNYSGKGEKQMKRIAKDLMDAIPYIVSGLFIAYLMFMAWEGEMKWEK